MILISYGASIATMFDQLLAFTVVLDFAEVCCSLVVSTM